MLTAAPACNFQAAPNKRARFSMRDISHCVNLSPVDNVELKVSTSWNLTFPPKFLRLPHLGHLLQSDASHLVCTCCINKDCHTVSSIVLKLAPKLPQPIQHAFLPRTAAANNFGPALTATCAFLQVHANDVFSSHTYIILPDAQIEDCTPGGFSPAALHAAHCLPCRLMQKHHKVFEFSLFCLVDWPL